MNHNQKTKHLTILLLIVALFAVGAGFASSYYRDRQKYISAIEDIDYIVRQLSGSGTPSWDKNEYCLRNSLKYKKGKLFCYVTATKAIDGGTIKSNKINKIAEKIGWSLKGSNQEALNDSTTKYVLANLYSTGDMNCFARGAQGDNGQLNFEVGCYGPAKAEWFPVRES